MDYAEAIGQQIAAIVREDGEYAEIYGRKETGRSYKIGVYDLELHIYAEKHLVVIYIVQNTRDASDIPSVLKWTDKTSCWGLLAADTDEATRQAAIPLITEFVARAIKES